MRTHCVVLSALTLSLFACSSKSSSSSSSASDASAFVLAPPSIPVPAGSEKYVCYAVTLDEDLAVDRFEYAGQSFVHHVFLSQATSPEPEGLSECDVVFRTTWLPLYLSGKGGTPLEYPPGDANVLPKGTQVVLQLHLLNATSKDTTVDVRMSMRRSTAANPTPVGVYAFGTQVLSIPPGGPTSISNECTPSEDVTSFAMFSHEHQIGTKLTFETMGADGQYKTVYTRDPFDFSNQVIEPIPMTIPKGTKTRVTCSYDNRSQKTVTYGESSNDEMCYLAMFVPGKSGAFGCVKAPPSDAGAGDGGTCDATPNELGVGRACKAGGSECGAGMSCSADLQSAAAGTPGFCMKVGCSKASECGSAATCCSPSQGGGLVSVCLPSTCVPSDCAIKP